MRGRPVSRLGHAVAFTKKDRGPWIVSMLLDDWKQLVRLADKVEAR